MTMLTRGVARRRLFWGLALAWSIGACDRPSHPVGQWVATWTGPAIRRLDLARETAWVSQSELAATIASVAKGGKVALSTGVQSILWARSKAHNGQTRVVAACPGDLEANDEWKAVVLYETRQVDGKNELHAILRHFGQTATLQPPLNDEERLDPVALRDGLSCRLLPNRLTMQCRSQSMSVPPAKWQPDMTGVNSWSDVKPRCDAATVATTPVDLEVCTLAAPRKAGLPLVELPVEISHRTSRPPCRSTLFFRDTLEVPVTCTSWIAEVGCEAFAVRFAPSRAPISNP